MMDIKEFKKVSFLNRSGILYLFILMVVLSAVNLRYFEEQYSVYLRWKFANENHENYKAGVLYYESLTRLYPSRAKFFADLSVCYYRLGETDKAVAAYDKAIAIDPSYRHDGE